MKERFRLLYFIECFLHADTRFEVEDVVADADKGLVIGTQTVSSFAVAAQELVPKSLQQYTEPVLPKLAPGKVPTAIQLRFGKNDAGRSLQQPL
jgi:hypothetical protein